MILSGPAVGALEAEMLSEVLKKWADTLIICLMLDQDIPTLREKRLCADDRCSGITKKICTVR